MQQAPKPPRGGLTEWKKKGKKGLFWLWGWKEEEKERKPFVDSNHDSSMANTLNCSTMCYICKVTVKLTNRVVRCCFGCRRRPPCARVPPCCWPGRCSARSRRRTRFPKYIQALKTFIFYLKYMYLNYTIARSGVS